MSTVDVNAKFINGKVITLQTSRVPQMAVASS